MCFLPANPAGLRFRPARCTGEEIRRVDSSHEYPDSKPRAKAVVIETLSEDWTRRTLHTDCTALPSFASLVTSPAP